MGTERGHAPGPSPHRRVGTVLVASGSHAGLGTMAQGRMLSTTQTAALLGPSTGFDVHRRPASLKPTTLGLYPGQGGRRLGWAAPPAKGWGASGPRPARSNTGTCSRLPQVRHQQDPVTPGQQAKHPAPSRQPGGGGAQTQRLRTLFRLKWWAGLRQSGDRAPQGQGKARAGPGPEVPKPPGTVSTSWPMAGSRGDPMDDRSRDLFQLKAAKPEVPQRPCQFCRWGGHRQDTGGAEPVSGPPKLHVQRRPVTDT